MVIFLFVTEGREMVFKNLTVEMYFELLEDFFRLESTGIGKISEECKVERDRLGAEEKIGKKKNGRRAECAKGSWGRTKVRE